ncbi:SWI5-dependent HO expression protein 4 [Rhodotorula sphaerocarpa]
MTTQGVEGGAGSASSSTKARLQTILQKAERAGLDAEEVRIVSQALLTTGEDYALALAALARGLSSPTASTSAAVRDRLNSLLSGTDSQDLIEGFRLCSSIFQVAPEAAASLVKDERIAVPLQEAIETTSSSRSRPSSKGKEKQDQATTELVDLLSTTAAHPSVRTLIAEAAAPWLESLLGGPEDPIVPERRRLVAAAGAAVVKLRLGSEAAATTGLPAAPKKPSARTSEGIARRLVKIGLTLEPGDGQVTGSPVEQDSILLPVLEALAFLTLTPSPPIKAIASSNDFLRLLFRLIASDKRPSSETGARDYAFATLLRQLSAFPEPRSQSEEAQQLEQLKRFAAAAGREDEELAYETVEAVEARVTRVVRLEPSPIPVDVDAVQALAKLFITAKPLLIFGPTPAEPLLVEATSALTLPLGAGEGISLLATFECLMALTNVASLDPSLADALVRQKLRDRPEELVLTAVEERLLSPNKMVCRAATELVCNLTAADAAIEYFEPPVSATSAASAPSPRLQVLVALTSSPDPPTQLAATGALASLVYSPSTSTALCCVPAWRSTLVRLLGDSNPGVRHRIYETWRVIGTTLGQMPDGEDRAKVRTTLQAESPVRARLEEALKAERAQELRGVVQAAIEAIGSV